MRRLFLTTLLAGALGHAAFATVTLQLSSGATTVTVADGSGSDINPLAGTVSYSNPSLNGWVLNITSGTSHSPNLVPFGIDLTSLVATCSGGPCSTDPLHVLLSDTDFNVPVAAGGFTTTYSGTLTGSAASTSESAYFSNTNALFAETTLIGTVGPFNAPGGAGSASGGAIAAVPPYSLTLDQVFNAGGGPASFSVDGNITAVPEPATVGLFGTL